MTTDIARLIFTKGELKFEDTKVYFDGNGQYHLVKNQVPTSGTYEIRGQFGKVYLRTEPPILSDKKDLEITICLENLPVTISQE